MIENLLVVYQALPYFLKGTVVTMEIVLGGLAIGLIIGVPLAIGEVYGKRYIANLISAYVTFFRGIPFLVLLFLFYLGIFPSIGINMSALAASILIIGLRDAAYQSQLFRGSIQSISEGQILAASSLGMTKFQAIYSIILPQALRISIPGWSNLYAIMLKNSAICYAVGVMELLTRASFVSSRTYKPMPVYLSCAVIFIILTYGGVRLLSFLENKVKIPGYGEER
jgi:polar amino acid transport system permease protein